jgi:Calx-beta domain-containing protein
MTTLRLRSLPLPPRRFPKASGDAPFASNDVTLSAPSGRAVPVDYTTIDGSASSGSDYDLTAGTLEFPAGQTLGSISVRVIGDNATEGDETIDLDLATP